MKIAILHRIFRQKEDFVVYLSHSDRLKKDCPIAVIPVQQAWNNEPFKRKIISCLTLHWIPSEKFLQELAHEIFIEEVFGNEEDLGEPLLEIITWHFNRNWVLENLLNSDIEKSEALEAMTVLTRMRYWKARSPRLNLLIAKRAPQISILLAPVVAKIPIRSIQYFIDIHSRYAFNSVRKAGHESSDQIITYLYDVLFLQQKIAVTLHSLLHSIDIVDKTKNDSAYIMNEMDAILYAELLFTYLKASIEKIIALIGYIYNIKGIENKKTHNQKIKGLMEGVPKRVKRLPYYHFIDEFISTKNLEDLNKYRTGLLHKKGIAELQPHNYFGKKDTSMHLFHLFEILHEQHAKNSAVLIASAALLTDELVRIDLPEIKMEGIPTQRLLEWLKPKS